MVMALQFMLGTAICFAGLLFVDGAITWTLPAGGDATKADIQEGTTGAIYTFTATATGSLTYTLDSQSVADTFTFSATTRVLTLATGKTLDFDTNPTHVIKVKAVESAATPVTSTGTLTINLVNVNEAPTTTFSSATVTVANGLPAGSTVATVLFTDQDAGDVVTHSFKSGNAAGHFVIGSTSGVVTVASGTTLASTNQYTLVIKAVDDDATPLTGSTTLSVCVGTCNSSAVFYLSLVTLLSALMANFL